MSLPTIKPHMFDASGFRRSILIRPAIDQVLADLEDDFHRFSLRLSHQHGQVTNVASQVLRFPWSTCPAAAIHLRSQLIGMSLTSLRDMIDAPKTHCTHLLDLAYLCAAHAEDASPTRYDIFVGDPSDDRALVQCWRNETDLVLDWTLTADRYVAEPDGPACDIRAFSKWRGTLAHTLIEPAEISRRAILVSRARHTDLSNFPTAGSMYRMIGACYSYQQTRADTAAAQPNMVRTFDGTANAPLDSKGI